MPNTKKSSRKPTGGHASDHFPGIGGIRLLGFYQLSSFSQSGVSARLREKVQGNFLTIACTEFETD
ncbi:MAG: hypothetical protein GC192_13985 [Bacteroidetes bacterium]|nr:hypothetical protein [Bacteroidota bacterium]